MFFITTTLFLVFIDAQFIYHEGTSLQESEEYSSHESHDSSITSAKQTLEHLIWQGLHSNAEFKMAQIHTWRMMSQNIDTLIRRRQQTLKGKCCPYDSLGLSGLRSRIRCILLVLFWWRVLIYRHILNNRSNECHIFAEWTTDGCSPANSY